LFVDKTGEATAVATAKPTGNQGTFSTTVTIPPTAALGNAELVDDNTVSRAHLRLRVVAAK